MCVIISQPANGSLPEIDMVNAMRSNSHGFGYAYYDKESDRILADKGVAFTKEKMLEVWNSLKDKDVLFHFRIKTRGAMGDAQCHPFQVLSKDEGDPFDMWFAHNGTINHVTEQGDESDTMALNRSIIKPILKADPTLIENEGFQSLLKYYIGAGSKLCFIYDKGKKVIINKSAGADRGACWVSNAYSFSNTTTINRGSSTATSNVSCSTPTNYNYSADVQSITFFGEQISVGQEVTIFKNSDLDFSVIGKITRLYNTNIVVSAKINDDLNKDTREFSYYFSVTSGESMAHGGEYYIIPVADTSQKKNLQGQKVPQTETGNPTKQNQSPQEKELVGSTKTSQSNGDNTTISSGVSVTKDWSPEKVSVVFEDKTEITTDASNVWGVAGLTPYSSYVDDTGICEQKEITIDQYNEMNNQERFKFFMFNPIIMFLMVQDLIDWFNMTNDELMEEPEQKEIPNVH